MIYFVQAEIVGRIKIGYTSRDRAEERLAALEGASCVPLRLLATCPGSMELERKIHERFHEYRVKGEWFKPGPRLIRYIAKIQGRVIRKPKEDRRSRAADWLIGLFQQKREWSSNELFRGAEKSGISRDAIFEAKNGLRLPRARRTVLENGDVQWVWWVPSDWPHLEQPSEG